MQTPLKPTRPQARVYIIAAVVSLVAVYLVLGLENFFNLGMSDCEKVGVAPPMFVLLALPLVIAGRITARHSSHWLWISWAMILVAAPSVLLALPASMAVVGPICR
jgi:hypothetical protein